MTFSRWTCDEKGKIVGRQRQFIASADEGKSWSEPVDVGPMSANNQTLIVGDGGRLLESLSSTTGVNEVFASDDHGANVAVVGNRAGKATRRSGPGAPRRRPPGLSQPARMAFLSAQLLGRQRRHVGEDRIAALPRRRRQSAQAHPAARRQDARRDRPLLVSRQESEGPSPARLRDQPRRRAHLGQLPPHRLRSRRRRTASSSTPSRSSATPRIFSTAAARDSTPTTAKTCACSVCTKDFFTSTTPWPYDWQGRPLAPPPK